MSDFVITELTVSMKVSDKEYGNGPESFFSLGGKYSGKPLSCIGDTVDDSLVAFLSIWKTILVQRWAIGKLKTNEGSLLTAEMLQARIDKAEKRFAVVREGLRED